jgi:hypothetical protein
MIKQINTGIAELLLVKVPDEKTKILEQFPNGYFFLHYGSPKMDHSGAVYLAYKYSGATHYLIPVGIQKEFPDDYDSLGIAHELSEEVWATLVEKNETGTLYEDYELFRGHLQNYFDTATESGLSLLRANRVYAENPYEKPKFTPAYVGHFASSDYSFQQLEKQYNRAQESTGKWIILRKI